MREQMVREGEAVISQGEAGENFYIVAEGELCAHVRDSDAPPCSYTKGDCFGELALLYDNPRAATVTCTSRSALLYTLGRIPFRNLVSSALLKRKVGLEALLVQVPMLGGLAPEAISQLAATLETLDFGHGE